MYRYPDIYTYLNRVIHMCICICLCICICTSIYIYIYIYLRVAALRLELESKQRPFSVTSSPDYQVLCMRVSDWPFKACAAFGARIPR